MREVGEWAVARWELEAGVGGGGGRVRAFVGSGGVVNRMWLVGGEELCPKPGERWPAPPSCCSLQ